MDALVALEERMATLLHVHSDEFRAVETRVAQLEQLKMVELMVASAASASAAAADCAKAAEAAAKLIETSEGAMQCAAEVMEVAREAVKQLSADGVIPDLLADHCKSAACSARDTVLQALDECREDAEEFVEEVQQRAAQKVAGKRGKKK